MTEPTTTEVVPASTQPPARADHEITTIDRALGMVEKRIDVLTTLTKRAVQETNPRCWNRWPGGRFRLTYPGARKVAICCAVKMSEQSDGQLVDESGEVTALWVQATFGLPGGHDTFIGRGTCEIDDKFLTREQADGSRKPVRTGDLWKKALANCVVNGVTGLLGLGAISEGDLKDARIDVGAIEGVDVEASKKGRKVKDVGDKLKQWAREALEKKGETPTDSAIADWAAKKWDEIKPLYQRAAHDLGELAAGVKEDGERMLREVTAFDNFKGYRRVQDVSPKMIGRVAHDLRERLENQSRGETGGAPAEQEKPAEDPLGDLPF